MINIPPSLLINRWTMNAKAAVDSEVPSDGTLDDIIKVARFGTLSVRCSRMCYFASDSTHGYEKAKMAIDSLCTEIQSLKASTSAGVGGTVPRPNDAHPIHIKNPAAATTKGSVRRTNKSGAQPRKCGRCRQPGHTAKSCQSNIHKGDSTGGSNEGMLTSGTTPSMGVDANTFEFPYNESSATNYARMTNDDVLKMESMRSFRSKNNERTKKYVSDHMLGYINGEVEIPQLVQCCLRITYLFFPLLTKDVSLGQQRMGNGSKSFSYRSRAAVRGILTALGMLNCDVKIFFNIQLVKMYGADKEQIELSYIVQEPYHVCLKLLCFNRIGCLTTNSFVDAYNDQDSGYGIEDDVGKTLTVARSLRL
ncbi:hypothetical protein JRO89_XS11G0103500 [Xanthoceras sorbifolium]|uniref:CCHC-type domain-containing protein n=1 Tax=Xanthoceras sorbifolium TaxID=99658 RepID=A0ABQ8HF83_9ROSI|nr:hypothetical protein JRO89_XS11G0103500 [Xanthoceras sorbifolium]